MNGAETILQEGTNLVFAARNHVYDWDFGRAADVRLGIFIDDLLRCHLKLSGDVENISAVEQDRVLVLTALATLSTLESELAVQVHQLPLDFLCAALFH